MDLKGEGSPVYSFIVLHSQHPFFFFLIYTIDRKGGKYREARNAP